MDPEDHMQSKLSQSRKVLQYCMIPLIRVVKFIQTAHRMMVTREVKMGRSYYLMGTVSVWKDEHFLEMHGDDGCKTMEGI